MIRGWRAALHHDCSRARLLLADGPERRACRLPSTEGDVRRGTLDYLRGAAHADVAGMSANADRGRAHRAASSTPARCRRRGAPPALVAGQMAACGNHFAGMPAPGGIASRHWPQSAGGISWCSRATLRIALDADGAMRVPYRGLAAARRDFVRLRNLRRCARRQVTGGQPRPVRARGFQRAGRDRPAQHAGGPVYPGVEVHANVLSGLLDGAVWLAPGLGARLRGGAVARGGGAARAAAAAPAAGVRAIASLTLRWRSLVALDQWLPVCRHGLALPLASALLGHGAGLRRHQRLGHGAEGQCRRELAWLFGTYVPPELSRRWRATRQRYGMQARTASSPSCSATCATLPSVGSRWPAELRALINRVFTR